MPSGAQRSRKIIESLDLFSYKIDTLRSLRLERSGRCIQSFGLYVMRQDKHLFTAETQRAQRDCSFHVPLRRRHMKNTQPAALVPLRRTSLFSSARSAEENVCVCLRPSAANTNFLNLSRPSHPFSKASGDVPEDLLRPIRQRVKRFYPAPALQNRHLPVGVLAG